MTRARIIRTRVRRQGDAIFPKNQVTVVAIDFHNLEPPYLHIGLSDENMFGHWAYRINYLERSFAVRVLRGKKMRQLESCFNEISAAFQFPSYFGENWNAVEECLCDLEWVPAKGYVLLVANTIDVLSQEKSEEVEIFFRVLSRVPADWRKEKSPKPFHVVFQSSSGELDRLQQRFHSAGIEASVDTYTL